jgi:hypothetical protein
MSISGNELVIGGVSTKRAKIGDMDFQSGAITGVATIDGLPYPPSASLPQFLPANGIMTSTGQSPPNPVLQSTTVKVLETPSARVLLFDGAGTGMSFGCTNIASRLMQMTSAVDSAYPPTDYSVVQTNPYGVNMRVVEGGVTKTETQLTLTGAIEKTAVGEYINQSYRQAFPSIHRFSVSVYDPANFPDKWPPGTYTTYPNPSGEDSVVGGQLVLSDRCNPIGAQPPVLPLGSPLLGFPVRFQTTPIFPDNPVFEPANAAVRGAAPADREAVTLADDNFTLRITRPGYYRISFNLSHFFNGGNDLTPVSPVQDTGDDIVVVQVLPKNYPIFAGPPILNSFCPLANIWPWLTVGSKTGSSSACTKIFVSLSAIEASGGNYDMEMRVYINWKISTSGMMPPIPTCCNINLSSCIEIDYMGDDTYLGP